jgi:phospholipid transport system substrate-binding protein
VFCGILAVCLLIPLPLQAGAVTDHVRATVEKVLAILHNPDPKSEARKEERYTRLRHVISSTFDLTEMAKRSLGPHWQGLTPNEQGEFVRLFSELFADSYLNKIRSYIGEKFVYLHETQDGDFSEVVTKIIRRRTEEFAVNYKLRSDNGEWKVYDVVVENVSLVNNYRAQFNRSLTTASFAELLHKLQQKRVKEPGPEKLRLDTIVSYSIMSAAGLTARPH